MSGVRVIWAEPYGILVSGDIILRSRTANKEQGAAKMQLNQCMQDPLDPVTLTPSDKSLSLPESLTQESKVSWVLVISVSILLT